MELNLLFATALGVEENLFDEQEVDVIAATCYEINHVFGLIKHEAWLSGNKSPANSYGFGNLSKNSKLSFMFKKITNSVEIFSNAHRDLMSYECSNSWFNIYKADQFQEAHNHTYPSIYSAVYFLKVPQGSGAIVFQNPSIQTIPEDSLDGYNELNSSSQVVNPRGNSLVIFKSSLMHYVLPGINTEDRISIAMNFSSYGGSNNDS